VIDKESFNTDFSKSQQEAMDIFKNVWSISKTYWILL
jgi:hypothetical protein